MQNISEQELLTEFVTARAPAVVEFYSPQCGHCRMLAATLAQVSAEFPKVRFVQADVTAETSLAERFDIQSVPTLLFWKNGEVYDRTVGNLHPQVLRDTLSRLVEA